MRMRFDVGVVAVGVGLAALLLAVGSARADGSAPTNLGAPVLTGDDSNAGNVLSVSDGTWDGSPTGFTYEWDRCDLSMNCVAIGGATSNTYTIQVADLGFLLEAVVTATNADGSTPASAVTEILVGVPRVTGSLPAITGDLSVEGNELSVSNGDWSGAGTLTFSYVWDRCNFTTLDCNAIGGATDSTYTTQPADLGFGIVVEVTAMNSVGQGGSSASSYPYLVGVPQLVTSPEISGTPNDVGAVLSVDDGTWTSSPTSYTFQWRSCDSFGLSCVDITGATSSTYTIQADDFGHRLLAEVTAANAAGSATASTTTILVSDPRPVLISPPAISGDTSGGGNLLSVTTGTWSNSPTSFLYQWLQCDANGENCTDIFGATASTYTTQVADLGHVLAVIVDANNAHGSANTTTQTFFPIGAPILAGLPVISGDETDAGNMISVSTGTWQGSPTITYQWQQCDSDGGNCAAISGATASTYTIQVGDLGHVLAVLVTGTTPYGAESATIMTQAIAVPVIVLGDMPTIDGDTSAVGDLLTATTGTWTSSPTSYAYQWQQCDANGNNCTDILGATASTYTIQAGDLGDVLQVTITASNANGSGNASAQTGVVGLPSVVVAPEISGDTSGLGNLLSVDTGTWTGSPTTFSYQWDRCDDAGFSCVAIDGETASTYAIRTDDLGHQLRADVTASNAAGGTTTSTATVLVPNNVPAIVGADLPVVSGDPSAAGNVLAATTGTWTNSPTSYAYQWQRCTDVLETTCAAIAGATSSSYQLVSDDLGSFIAASVTATNGEGSALASSFAVGPVGAPEVVGFEFPTISGDTSAAGNVLTVSTGTWSGSPTFTYQWQQCDSSLLSCSDIPGATSSSYTIQPGDLAHVLVAHVAATNPYGMTDEYAFTAILGLPAIVGFQFPAISGDTSGAGNILTVSTGTWSGSPTFTYQWRQCDSAGITCSDIPGATGSTYTIQLGDLGHVVDAVVTATNSSGSNSSTASTFTPLGAPALVDFQFPEISGDTSAAGNALTVSTGTWSGSPTFTYQWQQCDLTGFSCSDIPGATSSSYTIQPGDLAHVLSVTVTATNAYGSGSSSARTVGGVGLPQVVDFEGPAISGDVSAVGHVLTVSTGNWTGSPTSYAYQWLRCDAEGANCVDIALATATTYTLQTADLGHIIDATVTATNAAGSTSSTAYTFTAVGAPAILNDAFPEISGSTDSVGGVLTVSTGTWSGSPTFTYQWSRCDVDGFNCVAIGGATASTYTIQTADIGHELQAGVTGTNANGSTLATATSQEVGVPRVLNFDFPQITGDETASGNVLSVSAGTWSGSPAITYQWSRCDATGFGCTAIGGATSSTYMTVGADLGHVLQATVTATNGTGSNDWPALTEWPIGTPELTGLFPTITGDTAAVGDVLTAQHGVWSGSPTFTYAWSRCDLDGFDCTAIGSATGVQYTLQTADLGHTLEVAVTATNGNGSTTRTAQTNFAIGAPEIVGAFPSITGNPTVVGSTLSVTNGTWVGATTIAYQWYRCSANGIVCNAIAGQTTSSYTLTSADMGQTLDADVIATNAHGSTTEEAEVLVGAPFNATLPTISGDLSAVGNKLTSTNGTWFGSPTFRLQWWRCDASGFNCDEISGATGTTYTLTSADVGQTLFLGVDATNAVGTTEADSLNTVVVGNGASQHLLSVTLAGSGAGSVTSNPAGIDCGGGCSAEFANGTNVVLTPTPAFGSTFAGWSGGGCSGTGGCSVNMSGDQSVTATFTATPGSPTITGFTPSTGGAHATVTVTGTNLTYTKSVKLNNESVPFTVLSATKLTFVVPADAATGTIAITTTSGMTTSAGTFTVAAPPAITSISPGSGAVGTVVTITGTNLGGVVGVKIGHILVVPSSVSGTQVTFAIPPGAVSGTIEVVSPAGTATSAGTFTITG